MPCNLCGKWNCVCQYSQPKQQQDFTSCFFSREAMKEHSDFHPQPKAEQGEPATLEEIRKAMIFGIPLYTHPKQRTWVGLTPTDMQKLSAEWWTPNENEAVLINWIEAKLKEKNT